ncbi:hypothetical protein [Actinomadura keratinilytica]|uniref:hypothetical protein n=1 Tax=Actinomadura keratinilytica TaxID=547461 RepID=UPI00360A2F4A
MRLIATAIVLSLAMVAGCDSQPEQTSRQRPPAGAAAGMDTYYKQRLNWSDCGDGFQCATAEVPLDYARPGGDRLRLSLTRLPAEDGSRRVGSLFTNPGGPGGSGVQFVRQAARTFGADVRKRFDIIGFDPRGVGSSSPSAA